MFIFSKSTSCVHISVCVSVRQRVSKPIAKHSVRVGAPLKEGRMGNISQAVKGSAWLLLSPTIDNQLLSVTKKVNFHSKCI